MNLQGPNCTAIYRYFLVSSCFLLCVSVSFNILLPPVRHSTISAALAASATSGWVVVTAGKLLMILRGLDTFAPVCILSPSLSLCLSQYVCVSPCLYHYFCVYLSQSLCLSLSALLSASLYICQ